MFMSQLKYIIILFLAAVLWAACSVPYTKENTVKYTQYVNTFIGTAPLTDPEQIGYTPPKNWRVWAGLTYPGTSLPNAMVQLSPITEFGSGAGYEYEDTLIHAFTHTNKGHWNLCNVPVLPIAGNVDPDGVHSSRFSHSTESSTPGFYEVVLEDDTIAVKLTSTPRCGFHHYQYVSGKDRKILFDLGKANHRVRNWVIERVGPKELQGFQEVPGETIFFYALLDQHITEIDVYAEGTADGSAVISIEDGLNDPVSMKIGLSFVSVENARKNLEHELLNKTFEEVRGDATSRWEELLSKIQVYGGTRKQRELFYSSLYRAFLWPALRSDVNGEYRDIKGEVQNKGFRYYTKPSLWDTYRNKLVLLSLLSPDVTADVIRSLHDRGLNTGFIPTFFHGDHAAAFIAGAYQRGVRDFDVRSTYELLLNNATKEGGTRPHILEYIEKGYISTPVVDSAHVETRAKAGVSKTLEYAYDDHALSLLARALGDSTNYQKLTERSKNYRHVFDPVTGFMRGRLEDGSWVDDFNPQYPYYEYMYREANAWHVSFFAPHDMMGLIDLYGGPGRFETKLDSLFSLTWDPGYIARNVSGFIGQYCHGNQPGHEAPFSWYFIGKPEKSQQIIDRILNDMYGTGDTGLALCGMHDAGEMSAWYVFSAAGLYPFSPADDEYLVTVPLFDKVAWESSEGKKLSIAHSGEGRSLEEIRINGEAHTGYFIPHEWFKKGASVEIFTGE